MFFKHYNKKGISCKIEIEEEALTRRNDDFIIKWKHRHNFSWNYKLPKKFRDVNEVINYILKKLKDKKMCFIIS